MNAALFILLLAGGGGIALAGAGAAFAQGGLAPSPERLRAGGQGYGLQLVAHPAGEELDYPVRHALEAGDMLVTSAWSVLPVEAGGLAVVPGSGVIVGATVACVVAGGDRGVGAAICRSPRPAHRPGRLTMRILPVTVTEPTTEPVTLGQLRGQIRVNDNVDDAMLYGWLMAARARAEVNPATMSGTWDDLAASGSGKITTL